MGREASTEIAEPVLASTQSGKEHRIAAECPFPKFPGLDRWIAYQSCRSPIHLCLVSWRDLGNSFVEFFWKQRSREFLRGRKLWQSFIQNASLFICPHPL